MKLELKMETTRTFIRLFLIIGLLATASIVSAQTWMQTSAPTNQYWESVALSADGSKIIATGLLSCYFTSTNSGITWTSNSTHSIAENIGSWISIASSADGNKLAAASLNSVYTSTNAGISWTSNNVPVGTNLISIASSADGTKLVTVVGGTPSFGAVGSGYIYISTNSGTTWTQTSAPKKYWSSVASSADGTKLVATTEDYNPAFDARIYTSTNSGFTWTQTSAPTNALWAAVASSADGSKLVAVNTAHFAFVNGNYVCIALGLVYTSTDSGATWVSNNVPNNGWQSVASSADGTKLVAIPQSGGIFTSTNSGATWTSNNVNAFPYWAVASSADGNKQVMVVDGGSIYISQTTPSPQLNLTPSSTNLTLGWTVPSTNFVLQQSANLTSWANVTNPPVLNCTNLQNQVMISPSNSSCFYRLKTP